MERLRYSIKLQRQYNKLKKRHIITTYVNFDNLDKAEVAELHRLFGGVVTSKGTFSLGTREPNNDQDPYTRNILLALKWIGDTGEYEVPQKDEFMFELSNAEKDIVSKEESSKVEKSADEMWLKFMKEIEKPEVKQLLYSIGMYNLSLTSYGWRLAAENVVRAYTQKPDATFLQTRSSWAFKYNRRIKPNATRVVLLVPWVNSSLSADKRDTFMKDRGYDKSYSDLSMQQKQYVDIMSTQDQGYFFEHKAYYDVSDTELIDNSKGDIWAEEVGFINNLTGELNEPAEVEQMALNPEAQKEYNDAMGQFRGADIKALCEALAKGITARFGGEVEAKQPQGDKYEFYESAYSTMISNLASKLIADKCKVVKKENQGLGVKIATTIVMCLTKVMPANVAKSLANGELTNGSYFELRNVINSIIGLIETYSQKVNESIKLNEMELQKLSSVDELLSMIGMNMKDVRNTNVNGVAEAKEAVRNTFNMMLDKINECDKQRAEWREE